jgi:hypothetical protein
MDSDKRCIRGLYLNARSLVHKTDKLQLLACDVDIVAVTETWLKPCILDSELLSNLEFTIHRRDRTLRAGGGVMLAVRNNIISIRRHNLECKAELLACEIRPGSRRKVLVVVFYRPPDSNLDYLKELKKTLILANKSGFDQLFICGDFNLPNINWQTGVSITNDCISTYFTKLVHDNYLWQLVDFPTRIDHTLDLILTNIPDKVVDIHGFEDIINTDHKLISFTLDFNIRKIPVTKRYVYNYKSVNWNALNESLMNVPWDMAFVYNDIDASLANWCDLFLSTVSDHVPKRRVKNTRDHPWLDDELLKAIKHKNRCRKKALKTRNPSNMFKFKEIRRKTKQLILLKKKDHMCKLKV